MIAVGSNFEMADDTRVMCEDAIRDGLRIEEVFVSYSYIHLSIQNPSSFHVESAKLQDEGLRSSNEIKSLRF